MEDVFCIVEGEVGGVSVGGGGEGAVVEGAEGLVGGLVGGSEVVPALLKGDFDAAMGGGGEERESFFGVLEAGEHVGEGVGAGGDSFGADGEGEGEIAEEFGDFGGGCGFLGDCGWVEKGAE